MSTNLDRFRKDLDRLISLGDSLHNSMQHASSPVEFKKVLIKQLTERGDSIKDAEAAAISFFGKLPDFGESYEAWYSESLALLRQLLPDRVENFISLYEKPKGRKDITNSNYVIRDYLQGIRVTQYGETKVSPSAALPQYRQQVSILKAAKTRFESSLFEIRQLVQADLLDSEIDIARELLKNKFVRPAGTVAGVVLEKHLKQVSQDRNLTISKKHPTISDFNELLKANGVIDVPQWRHISMLADVRNLCSHNREKEPTTTQVSDLIDGVDKIIKTVA